MAVRMTKPFVPLTEAAVAALPAHLGVFELADAAGAVRRIGYAGGRDAFGIRTALAPFVGRYPSFRWESTTAYRTRWAELVMVHVADHGDVPPDQPEPASAFGRLSPS